MPPTVSVVIPLYNRQRFVSDAITSVLAQTWPDLECIVVDDGSTDGGSEIVQGFTDDRLLLVHKSNERSVARARNFGARIASGTYLAFLDADDVWLPAKLSDQLMLFDDDPELGLAYCGYAITDSELRPSTVVIPSARNLNIADIVLTEANGLGAGSTMMVRAEVFHRVGGFDPSFSISEDLDFVARVCDRWQVGGVDKCLVLYRTHPHQNHRNLRALAADTELLLARRFPRPMDAGVRRRGLANLQTRLFAYYLLDRRPLPALSALLRVLATQPSRLLQLPISALGRRIHRRRLAPRYLEAAGLTRTPSTR